jgi:hypothetical protein
VETSMIEKQPTYDELLAHVKCAQAVPPSAQR